MDHPIKLHEEKKSRHHKVKLPPAPRELFSLPNADKDGWTESYANYDADENLARFPHPFRCCILGRVSSGKSLVAKFIIMAHQASLNKFQEVYVIHGSAKTTEWDDVEPTEIINEIPSYEEFDETKKTLLIFDDTDWTSVSKEDLKKVSELFRFGSSHHNISILLLHQIFSRVPKICRDCSNVLILYRPVDLDSLNTVGRRSGLKKEEIIYIFDNHMPDYRNSLTVNLIPNAPHKFLKDVFEPLSLPFYGGS